MPSDKNVQGLEKSKQVLKEGKGFYFTDFTGITVQSLEHLRRELKKNHGEYIVIKNTLGSIAFRELGLDEVNAKRIFVGATGIAVAYDDPIVLAKILKDTSSIKIKGGMIEGSFYDTPAVIRLALTPPRDILIAGLVGTINLAGNLVGVLQGNLRDLVYTLEMMTKKEKK